MSAQTEQESFSFQAEVVQILDLMVHSLYSNKEIFLRELISNASDAIDRLRLELLSRSELPDADGPLRIRVSYDAGARTIARCTRGPGCGCRGRMRRCCGRRAGTWGRWRGVTWR